MNFVVHINGVSRTSVTIQASLRVHLGSHSEPSTASFTLRQGTSVPVQGQLVTIGWGTVTNAFYFGQIVRVTHRRTADFPEPFFDVECVDGTRLLNRRIVTTEYTAMTATDIAIDLIEAWTSDFFTTTHIQSGLPTIASFPLVNTSVADALTDLFNLIGGGWHLTKTYGANTWDVRGYGPDGELAPFAPTRPRPLMDPLPTLHTFSHTYDGSQIRTRDLVETGSSATLMVEVPASATHFPVSDSAPFSPTGGKARIHTQLITYDRILDLGQVGPNSATTTITADVSAGATSVTVTDLTVLTAVNARWFQAGQQVFYSDSGNLDDIPASGYGAILGDIQADTEIVALSIVAGVLWLNPDPLDRPAQMPVNPYVQIESTGAQANVAAVEGGDGIHEHFIPAPDFPTIASGTPIGEADIDAFANPLLSATWDTDDVNAQPGSPQVIHFGGTDPIDAVITIQTVDLSFPVGDRRPMRRCQGGTVKREGLTEALLVR